MKSYISAFALVAALTGASRSRPSQYYGGHGKHGGRAAYKGSYGAGRGYGNSYGSGLAAYNGGYGNGYGNGYDSGYGNGYDSYGGGYGAYNGGYGNRGYGGNGYGNGYNAGYGAYDDYDSYGSGPVRQRHLPKSRQYIPYNHGHGRDYGLWNRSYKVKEETFEQVVIKDVENIWIVAYIDPECGACKKFSIEWEKLRTVETIKYKKVKLGYVDVTLEASRKIVGKYT